MLKRIKLKNFMSHHSSELELSEGVNVLIGPNNSGKSAVVSGLQLLAELPTREGTYMIRHGENESQVIVETCDGDEVIWGRKQSSSYLIINGEKHTRIGNNQEHFLNELHKILKLPQVKGKGEVFDIHFACQKEPIFLLNDPPSRAATFFSTSSEAGRLVEVRDLFKTKISRAKDKYNDLLRREQSLTSELEKLKPLEGLKPLVDNVTAIFQDSEKEDSKITAGCELLTGYQKCINSHAHFIAASAIYHNVLPPPVMDDILSLEKAINTITELKQKETELKNHASALRITLDIPQLEDIHAIWSTLKNIQDLESRCRILVDTGNALNGLKEIEAVEDLRSLQKVIYDLNEFSKAISQQSSCNDILAKLLNHPEFENPFNITKTIQDISAFETTVRLYQKQSNILTTLKEAPVLDSLDSLEGGISKYNAFSQEIYRLSNLSEKAQGYLAKWISEHPSCPTCGKSLNNDFSEVHEHV